ncbi:serine/threonine protein kinase [Actinospica durhamensis]|uniref:Serine/threonine protein kinase n=1 Tax=Actinospica durhamensis TaxID=1508375 RepID=A0A941ER52_9ACTN|nr:serine/threonine-protein kinase [Actinospica durhamensis]MBR7835643.1 serine/threonine protein kinase [Actinospica durhamensis]
MVGPYRIEAVLGQGGMGRVFLARDTRDERVPAAVKVLARTGDATAWSRFRRELAAARRVQGHGTARVLDGDGEADPPWLAVEYITGPTLDRLVAERGPLDAAAAAGLAVGVAGALGEIHAAGVVHRDLKPANIILSPDGPRVVDFGIARTVDATTLSVTGWAMGTPGYMAPEQITDPRTVGTAADVFALGSVLVFAATGASPYHGGDAPSVVYRIVHEAPRLSGVPASLRPLAEACLARDPAARPRVEAVAAAALRIVDFEAARSAERARELVEPLAATAPPRRVPELPAFTFPVPLPSPSAPGPSTPPGTPTPIPTPDPAVPPLPPAADPYDLTLATRTTAGRIPAGRRRRSLALLTVLAVAALGVSGWFAAEALAHPSPGASATGTSRTSGTVGARVGSTSFAGGTVVLGPGCGTSSWGVFSVTSTTLERGVGGGDPACGGAADAFRKSGSDAEASPPASRATWHFRFHRSVRCTLSVYIAAADPSSGRALYQVTAHGAVTTFAIAQGQAKGTFVTPAALTGLTAPNGDIELVLTDLTAAAGDANHVTASSVSAACQVA